MTSATLAESYRSEDAPCSHPPPPPPGASPAAASGRKSLRRFAATDPAPQGPRYPRAPPGSLISVVRALRRGGAALHLDQLCPMPGRAAEGSD